MENGYQILCSSCKKCGNECNSNPESSVVACTDYDPHFPSMSIGELLTVCDTCIDKSKGCTPNDGYDCTKWKSNLTSKDNDNVNHPSHYTQGGIECLDAIEAAMKPDQYRGYLKGNIIKYLWRYEWKNGLEDLKKAQFYMDRMVRSMEKEISTKGDSNATTN